MLHCPGKWTGHKFSGTLSTFQNRSLCDYELNVKFSTRGGVTLPCTTATLQISSHRLQLLGKPPQSSSVARAGVGAAQSSPALHSSGAAPQDSSELSFNPPGDPGSGEGLTGEKRCWNQQLHFRRYNLGPEFQRASVGSGEQEQTACSQ